MTVRKSQLAWPAVAVAMVTLATPDAAQGFGRDVYRSRTVIRGGSPVVLGAPGVRVGTGTRTESFLLAPRVVTGAESFLFGTTGAEFFSFGPGRASQENSLLAENAQLKAELSKKSPGGAGTPPPATPPAPTVTTTTVACPELVGRLDKIEGRLGALETRLVGIESKVDVLMAERAARARESERAALLADVRLAVRDEQDRLVVQLAERRAADNKALVGLIEESAKGDKADKDKVAKAKEALGVK
jgi:hypothetical protein